jgi:hypothetical protein
MSIMFRRAFPTRSADDQPMCGSPWTLTEPVPRIEDGPAGDLGRAQFATQERESASHEHRGSSPGNSTERARWDPRGRGGRSTRHPPAERAGCRLSCEGPIRIPLRSELAMTDQATTLSQATPRTRANASEYDDGRPALEPVRCPRFRPTLGSEPPIFHPAKSFTPHLLGRKSRASSLPRLHNKNTPGTLRSRGAYTYIVLKWSIRDSNPGPLACEASALTS